MAPSAETDFCWKVQKGDNRHTKSRKKPRPRTSSRSECPQKREKKSEGKEIKKRGCSGREKRCVRSRLVEAKTTGAEEDLGRAHKDKASRPQRAWGLSGIGKKASAQKVKQGSDKRIGINGGSRKDRTVKAGEGQRETCFIVGSRKGAKVKRREGGFLSA